MKFHELPKTYAELVALEAPRVISGEEHYMRAWRMIEAMAGFEDQMTQDQNDYLEILCMMVDVWEATQNSS